MVKQSSPKSIIVSYHFQSGTGVWPELIRPVVCWMLIMTCLTLSGECPSSRKKNGSRAIVVGDMGIDT